MSSRAQDALSIAVQAVIDQAPPAWNITDIDSVIPMLREALDEIAYVDFLYANANQPRSNPDDLSFLDDGIDAEGGAS